LIVVREGYGGSDDKTTVTVYGHSRYKGKGIVERALQATY
jgi:hypothetical protein